MGSPAFLLPSLSHQRPGGNPGRTASHSPFRPLLHPLLLQDRQAGVREPHGFAATGGRPLGQAEDVPRPPAIAAAGDLPRDRGARGAGPDPEVPVVSDPPPPVSHRTPTLAHTGSPGAP